MFSFKNFTSSQRIYLDHAAATPVDGRVDAVMREVNTLFANPSALYKEALRAQEALDEARLTVARVLGCREKEVVFVGGGTESCNLALRGVVTATSRSRKKAHIVTTAIEHSAVLETCRALEGQGVSVTYVPVDKEGVVSPGRVIDAIRPETCLVSVMYANNEIGTIQPVQEIGTRIRSLRAERTNPLYFHTDASQAACYLSVDPEQLKVDLMTLDGVKMYGPRGAGILYVKRDTKITPLIYGGGQEGGLRSGTEPVSLCVGVAEALRLAQKERKRASERESVLRDRLLDGIMSECGKCTLNGSKKRRLANNVNICFPGQDSEFLVMKLDALGVACSSSSACKTRGAESSSYVVEALGKEGCASSSVRLTVGRSTTVHEVDEAIARVWKALEN